MKFQKFGKKTIETIIELYNNPKIPIREIAKTVNLPLKDCYTLIWRLKKEGFIAKSPRRNYKGGRVTMFSLEEDLLLKTTIYNRVGNLDESFEIVSKKIGKTPLQVKGRWYHNVRKEDTVFATVGGRGLKNTKNIRRGTDIPETWYITINDRILNTLSIAGNIRDYNF